MLLMSKEKICTNKNNMITPFRTQLSRYSSLRVGGEGLVVEVSELKELVEALMYARTENLRVEIVGEGTNTFFATNLEGIFFIIMKMKGISLEEQGDTCLLTVSAGEAFDDVVKFSTVRNLWGIENLSLIPGKAGASPVQNIGAYGTELKDVLVFVSAVDTRTLDVVQISNDACSFGYRDSLFKREKGRYVIISITLALSCTPKPVLIYKPLDALLGKENLTPEVVRNCVIEVRKSKLPDYKEYPNAGSFFKNVVVGGAQAEGLRTRYPDMPLIEVEGGYKIPSAWLIEHIAQAKGVRVGDVGTWPDQPLVIVNYDQASPEDVLLFSNTIIERIKEKIEVELVREVNYIS